MSYVPSQYKSIFDQAVKKHGVDPNVLAAQINHESGWQVNARGYNSDSYDRGLAQVNSKWHPEISDKQADDPKFAIDWMARTMSEKYKRLGDWGKALSEYNTGNAYQGFQNGYVNAVLGGRSNESTQVQQQPTTQQQHISKQQPNLFEVIRQLMTRVPQQRVQPQAQRTQLAQLTQPQEEQNIIPRYRGLPNLPYSGGLI